MTNLHVALYPLLSGSVELTMSVYTLGSVSISTNMTPWQVADLLREIADQLPQRDEATP